MRTRSVLGFDLHAQAREAIERAAAIGRRGKMRDLACAFGQRRKHRVTMRNGFIAGNFEGTADRARRTNDLFCHVGILACRIPRAAETTPRKNFSGNP